MSNYNTCPHCGKHLNFGEACDCIGTLKEEALRLIMELTDEQCEELLHELRVQGIVK